ncbi:MAG: glycosyltransferase family 2 protein [Maritimibacter sp.]|nr:glycosyltransferase family 2 protein [Maritimibacter sp.]
MTTSPVISIVSPVYGCRDCLEALVDGVAKAFDGTPLDWELVLVDDRGPDDPWAVIEDLAARDPRVVGIRLSRNHGQHLAIWAGLQAARGDWVAVLDCDLQDDPQVIPELHAKALAEKVDAVVVDRGDWIDSVARRQASRGFYWMIQKLSGLTLNHNIGNFGLYSRRLVDLLLTFRDKEVFLPAMVLITGLPRSEYALTRGDRHAGASSYRLASLLRMALYIVIRFSDRPLKLSIVVGLAFSLFAAFFSVLLLFAWALGSFTVQGWTSVILSIWFLSGLILAVLGVHGFYVGRIFSEVQDRPRIFVETTTLAKDGS